MSSPSFTAQKQDAGVLERLENPPLIKVEGVSKKFCLSLKKSLWYGLCDMGRELTGIRRSPSVDQESEAASEPALRPKEFWAVRDVSFELRRGECLGLIGRNGAGKTTLLKMLNGLIKPDAGRITMHGRVGALIALGAGFNPILTGRENIYVNASVLGLSRKETDAKVDEIIDFAEIGEFIDSPVQNYSSGMAVRLGFAVASSFRPDILLLDEVLAVGDMEFQKKCIDRIDEMRQQSMAIVLVSHSLYRIESLCHRAIWLDHGRVVMNGPVREVVRAYRDQHARLSAAESAMNSRTAQDGNSVVTSPFFVIHRVEPVHADGRQDMQFAFGESIALRIVFTARRRIERPLFNLRFRAAGVCVLETSMLVDGQAPDFVEGPGELTVRLDHPRLLPNAYVVELFIRNAEGMVDLVEMQAVVRFTITSQGLDAIPQAGPYALGHLMHGNIMHQPYEWDVSRIRQSGREA